MSSLYCQTLGNGQLTAWFNSGAALLVQDHKSETYTCNFKVRLDWNHLKLNFIYQFTITAAKSIKPTVKILIISLLSAAHRVFWVSYFSFLNLSIILFKGNTLKESEYAKAPIISNVCSMNVVCLVMKNSANLTSCNIVHFYYVLAHDLKALAQDSSYLTHSNINTSLWPHWDYCPLRSKDAICQCAQHLYQQYTGQPSKIGVVLLHFCFVYKANNINNSFC